MFPDPTIRWRPYPSIIDGIKGPVVFNQGIWRGNLHLLVVGWGPDSPAYGITLDCLVYSAFDELILSCSGHGQPGGNYDGGVYIKEAESSQLLEAHRQLDPFRRLARHFSFVGGEFCYEVLATAEPRLQVFATQEEGYAWAPGQNSDP